MLKEFIFITPVWGDGHIKLFLEIGLPSLLASGNLPALAKRGRVKYFIYLKTNDAESFQRAAILCELKKIVDVSFIVFDDYFSNHHSAMSWCHKQGFNEAVERGSYAVFIPPDCIWSNQAMSSMCDIVERGYKIIHMSGIRLASELFSLALKPYQGRVDFTPRELVKLALPYLHPITCSHFFDEKEGGLMPANLFWTVDETGILARCFHLHPLLVLGVSKGSDFQSTIDDDLALVVDSSEEEEYIVADSDELVAFEISSLSHQVLAAYRKGNTEDIATWAETSTNAKHRTFIKTGIKIHGADAMHPGWVRAKRITDDVVSDILDHFEARKMDYSHQWLTGIKNNKYCKKIIAVYVAAIKSIMSGFYRLMRSGRGLYPWHWNFAFQVDVCTPFIQEIKNSSGCVLYFDDKYHPLISEIRHSMSGQDKLTVHLMDAKVVSSNVDSFSKLYNGYFDKVIIRDFDFSLTDDFWAVMSKVLKPNGTLICYVTDITKLGAYKSKLISRLTFVSEKNYGKLGTKIAINLYHQYVQNVAHKFSFMRRVTILNTIKLMLSPFLIMVYPMISLSAFFINCLSNQKHWAVKGLTFYHEGALKQSVTPKKVKNKKKVSLEEVITL